MDITLVLDGSHVNNLCWNHLALQCHDIDIISTRSAPALDYEWCSSNMELISSTHTHVKHYKIILTPQSQHLKKQLAMSDHCSPIFSGIPSTLMWRCMEMSSTSLLSRKNFASCIWIPLWMCPSYGDILKLIFPVSYDMHTQLFPIGYCP